MTARKLVSVLHHCGRVFWPTGKAAPLLRSLLWNVLTEKIANPDRHRGSSLSALRATATLLST